jgi:hypothetical protein
MGKIILLLAAMMIFTAAGATIGALIFKGVETLRQIKL